MRTAQQTKNLQDWLNIYWPAIKPEQVAEGLSVWRQRINPETMEPTCGTICCFGGHVALNPEAQAQGVYTDWEGVPILGMSMGYEVAERFFGDPRLFFPRGCHDSDDYQPDTATDHEIVTARLKWALEHDEVEA